VSESRTSAAPAHVGNQAYPLVGSLVVASEQLLQLRLTGWLQSSGHRATFLSKQCVARTTFTC